MSICLDILNTKFLKVILLSLDACIISDTDIMVAILLMNYYMTKSDWLSRNKSSINLAILATYKPVLTTIYAA